MIVHNVYFWFQKALDEQKKDAFLGALATLKKIENAEKVYIGEPAATCRPAIDRTYDVALTVLFKDWNAHDLYQSHELHKAFIKEHSSSWIKTVIYDHEDKGSC